VLLIDRIHLNRFQALTKRLTKNETDALHAAQVFYKGGYIHEYVDVHNPVDLVTAWELISENPVARERYARAVNIVIDRAVDLGWVEQYRCSQTGFTKYRAT
jgi:hypothetical protein